MRRRLCTSLSTLAVLSACSLEAQVPEPVNGPTKDPRPDIVLVVVDTLRADRLGCYGNVPSPSPILDEMATRGLRFDRAYAHSGWTLASFSSLFTGQLPHVHRVGRSPTDAHRYGRLPETTTTLAEALKSSGYATGAVMNNTFLAREFGLAQGFEHYDWHGANNSDHRTAEQTVDLSLQWLDAQQDPAFLVVHLMEPHLDYNPPDWAREAHPGPEAPAVPHIVQEPALSKAVAEGLIKPEGADRDAILALYDAEIRTADRAIGRLLDALSSRARPSWTVVTADHGEEFWDHGGFEHGHSLYGELVRTPLLVTGPDLTPGVSSTVVQHTDLFQMLVRLGGAARPKLSSGNDLLVIAASPPAGKPVAISENTLYGDPLVSITDGDLRLVLNQKRRTAEVWTVAPDGSETTRYTGHDAQAQANRLRDTLQRTRGNLRPVEPIESSSIDDQETFEQLRALGYLDETAAGD